MKTRLIFIIQLIIFFTFSIVLVLLFKSAKPKDVNLDTLKQRAYNDSILVSEYQEALDQYMEVDPKGADEFMRIIEKINTK